MTRHNDEEIDWTRDNRKTFEAVARLTPEAFDGLSLGQQERVLRFIDYVSVVAREFKSACTPIHKARKKALRESTKAIKRRLALAAMPDENKELEAAASDFAAHWLEGR